MKLAYFFSLVTLVPCIVQAQHIEDSLTRITFNKTKKTIAEWIRDERGNEFGKTKVLTIESKSKGKFAITTASTVAMLDADDFKKIAAGYAFYCRNIKKKNDIEYGVIVIDPKQHHFDYDKAQLIRKLLIDQYIERQLQKSHLGIKLEDSSGE